MSHIFISYSRRDKEIVDNIVNTLKEAGMEAWIDREDIRAGNSWRLQIVEAIEACDVFILVLSPNSAASDNVRKEIDLAQDSGRVTIPILLEPVKLPAAIRYQLAGLQFIDVPMLGLEDALKQLVNAVEHERPQQQDEPTTKQVELVIEGVDLAAFDAVKQQQLIEFLANLSGAKQSQLKIAKLSAGSVHAFVDMSTQTAYQLKTMALNREARFKELGIVSLRLVGNLNFIDISRGTFSKTAATKSAKSLWPRISFTIFFILTALILLWMFVFAPKSQTPNIPATPTPTLTVTPTLTFTNIPTEVPPTATLTVVHTPTQYKDRCSLFDGENIQLVTLSWYSGAPLIFYLKFPNGIPGLENKDLEDGQPWNYSVSIAGKDAENCRFIEGYKTRLYCSISLSSAYSYTLVPLTLRVNNCETPIFSNPVAELPKIKSAGNNGGSSCGPTPALGSSGYLTWCTCVDPNGLEDGFCITPN